jgi:sigma-B regulation protein RsbU (phosphoserine phosphatase)
MFTYTNAGHYPPLVLRANGELESAGNIGPGLNIIKDSSYETSEIALSPGDLLLLYTDGVLDIFNNEGEDFGIERLKEEVRKSGGMNAKHLIERIIKTTKEFSGKNFFTDDFTLIVVRRLS